MSNECPSGHSQARELNFSRLLPARPVPFNDGLLAELAATMAVVPRGVPDLDDGPDFEENLYTPAGYTYLGQFIDHDLTFDTTSNLANPLSRASNLRTPSLDLDCLYGAGPDDQPYLYSDGARLEVNHSHPHDLPRALGNQRALIGDKRNDENSIVCQLQRAFIHFHNRVCDALAARDGLSGSALYERARQEVTWTYQRIVLDDFLPRIVRADVLQAFRSAHAVRGAQAYALYTEDKRHALPIEFAGAAYRFGHSMVRTGYRLNGRHAPLPIFDGKPSNDHSLVGFQPLPAEHQIEWARFVPDDHGPAAGQRPAQAEAAPPVQHGVTGVRLQYAYRLDTSLTDPLAALPPGVGPGNLALLNLRRGNLPTYALQTGQTFALALGETPLADKYLRVRMAGKAEKTITWVPIDPALRAATPLWFYVLAEAQVAAIDTWYAERDAHKDLPESAHLSGPAAGAQLGPVGGRIVTEVLHGALDADDRSVMCHPGATTWQPLVGPQPTLWKLLKFAGEV